MGKEHKGEEFSQILLGAIDDAFSMLGEKIKETLYFHLECDFLISKQDIPDRVQDFSDALERILGVGAQHLELLIMKTLHDKVQASYRWEGPNWLIPDLTFPKYVTLMEIAFSDRSKTDGVEIAIEDEEKQTRVNL